MKSQPLLLFPLILFLLPAVFLGIIEPVPSAIPSDAEKKDAAPAETRTQKISAGSIWATGPETKGIFVHMMFMQVNQN